MENDKTLFYIVAIVAIVAIFAMVFMAISARSSAPVVRTLVSGAGLTTDTGDSAGQAIGAVKQGSAKPNGFALYCIRNYMDEVDCIGFNRPDYD